MVGPPLIPPDRSDHDLDYVPSAAVLATLPSSNPNQPAAHPGALRELFDVESPGVVLRAAAIPDIRILRGLLRHGFPATNYIVGPLNGPWESALTNAIRAGLPDHVKLLLEHGANPNGFPDSCFDSASTRFLRGRASAETLTAGCYLKSRALALDDVRLRNSGNAFQETDSVLTKSELDQRRGSRSRFWAEPDFPRTDFPTNNPMTALSVATKFREPALYELLVRFGADETAWIEQQAPLSADHNIISSSVDAHAPSRWEVEPPLTVAISNRDEGMLQFLLDRGHRPEHFPETLITRSMNALSTALLTRQSSTASERHHHQQPWTAGFDMMAPRCDTSLLTPLFRCHVMHFAVATLDLSLLKHVLEIIGGEESATMLQHVPHSAVGHNLLHIASLPIDDGVVNMHSEPIYLSNHEFRTTDSSWRPLELLSEPPIASTSARGGRGRRGAGRWRRSGSGRFNAPSSHAFPGFQDVPQHELSAQANVMDFLIKSLLKRVSSNEWGGDMMKQDVHGNTPLHYLASIRNPDWELIAELIEKSPDGSGKRAWDSQTNLWGFTAESLYKSGKTSKADWDQKYMPFWKSG